MHSRAELLNLLEDCRSYVTPTLSTHEKISEVLGWCDCGYCVHVPRERPGVTTESEKETEPYELAALLDMFRSDLHPAYANTSQRGRSIGGQAITSQCNYLDPEGDEYRIIDRIDRAVQEWFRRAEREGVDMHEVRRQIMGVGQ